MQIEENDRLPPLPPPPPNPLQKAQEHISSSDISKGKILHSIREKDKKGLQK